MRRTIELWHSWAFGGWPTMTALKVGEWMFTVFWTRWFGWQNSRMDGGWRIIDIGPLQIWVPSARHRPAE